MEVLNKCLLMAVVMLFLATEMEGLADKVNQRLCWDVSYVPTWTPSPSPWQQKDLLLRAWLPLALLSWNLIPCPGISQTVPKEVQLSPTSQLGEDLAVISLETEKGFLAPLTNHFWKFKTQELIFHLPTIQRQNPHLVYLHHGLR